MMSEDIVVEDWRGAKPQPKAGRFDRISIAVHWLTVVLVATQFATAWLLNLGGSDASRILLVHRSIGILTWVVVVLRLIWRHAFAYLPPFPVSMPKLQQWIAKLNEYGLYGLLLVQPLTGLGNTLLHGRPFALFVWQVPKWLAPDKSISLLFQSLHELAAWLLLALIGIHAAAALFHGLILRDGVLQRMLPGLVVDAAPAFSGFPCRRSSRAICPAARPAFRLALARGDRRARVGLRERKQPTCAAGCPGRLP